MSRLLACEDETQGLDYLSPPSPISEIQGGPHFLPGSEVASEAGEPLSHGDRMGSDDLGFNDGGYNKEGRDSDSHLERESVYIGPASDEQSLDDDDELDDDDDDDDELSDPDSEHPRAPPLPLEHIYVQDPRQPLLLSDFDVIKTLGGCS